MEQIKNELSILKKTVEVVQNDMAVNKKSYATEFQRIGQAFQRFGELIDLLYLEVSVLIELFDKKEIINQDEFKAQLEETGKKMEEEAKANYEKMMKEKTDKRDKDDRKQKKSSK